VRGLASVYGAMTVPMRWAVALLWSGGQPSARWCAGCARCAHLVLARRWTPRPFSPARRCQTVRQPGRWS